MRCPSYPPPIPGLTFTDSPPFPDEAKTSPWIRTRKDKGVETLEKKEKFGGQTLNSTWDCSSWIWLPRRVWVLNWKRQEQLEDTLHFLLLSQKKRLRIKTVCAVMKCFHFLHRFDLWLFKFYLLQIPDNMQNGTEYIVKWEN